MVRTCFFINQPELTKPSDSHWLAPKPVSFKKGKSRTVIEIPNKWLGFFQALLLAPAQHSWAKKLLETEFPQLLQEDSEWMRPINIATKPSMSEECSRLTFELETVKGIEEALLEDATEDNSPKKKRGRKGKSDTPIVDSAVRRSTRVRANTNGFMTSPCKSKNYLGCSADPPTLSPSTIKKIGTSLCNLPEDLLEEQVLAGKKKMEPVGKKLKKNKEDKKKNDNDKNEDN